MVATPLVVEFARRGGSRKMLLSEIPVGVLKANLSVSPRVFAWARTASALAVSLPNSEASGPVRRS